MGIELKNLEYKVGGKRIITNVTSFFESNKLTVLFGPNGSGKTILLKLMSGLIKGYNGDIFIYNKNIKEYSQKELGNIVGYVPPSSHSVFNYSVMDYILMGKVAGKDMFYIPTNSDKKRVKEILLDLDILNLENKNYNTLSTGEKQLVLICRCLIKDLPVVFLDEPVSNLDFYNQHKVFKIIKKLKEKGVFIITSIHDPTLALRYGENIILLEKGDVYRIISPDKNTDISIFKKYLSTLYSKEVSIIRNKDRYFVDVL